MTDELNLEVHILSEDGGTSCYPRGILPHEILNTKLLQEKVRIVDTSQYN
jgi:hypothetical protein